MKANAPTINASSVIAAETPVFVEKSMVALLADLFKLRLTTLVLLTTLAGFYLASRGPVSWGLMVNTLLGTALLAAGASALNQLLEREHDAHMRRTMDRPLPSGRMTPETALIIGGLTGMAGLIWLALTVNLLTAVIGAITLGSYVFIYTPLKRITTLNTVVGAIPGALPPLMGWTAARGQVSPEGWSLFAIMCFWQLPHFLAIAWMYRAEYAKAGFVMLPMVDPEGERTGRQAFCHTLGLLPMSLAPFLFKMDGTVYLIGALVLGLAFMYCAFQFAHDRTALRAKALFYMSITYLPLLLGLMVFDKLPT